MIKKRLSPWEKNKTPIGIVKCSRREFRMHDLKNHQYYIFKLIWHSYSYDRLYLSRVRLKTFNSKVSAFSYCTLSISFIYASFMLSKPVSRLAKGKYTQKSSNPTWKWIITHKLPVQWPIKLCICTLAVLVSCDTQHHVACLAAPVAGSRICIWL